MGAWIETTNEQYNLILSMSHPTWVRGLKQLLNLIRLKRKVSHPTWVRGLKLAILGTNKMTKKSHPTWVRGLKQVTQKVA